MGGKGGGRKGASKGQAKGTGKGKGAGKGAPKPEVPDVKLPPKGTRVYATAWEGSSQWWPGVVVQLRGGAKPGCKVQFSDDTQAWVGPDQVWSEPAATLPEVGARCQVDVGTGKYHSAQVVQVSETKKEPVKVSVELWVTPSQLKAVQKAPAEAAAPAKGAKAKAAGKAKAAPKAAAGKLNLPVGTQLTAQFSDGKLYKATVLATRKGAKPVKVHFEGWDDSFDEWKSLDEVKSKLLTSAPAAPEPKAEAKSKAKAKGKAKAKAKSNDDYDEGPPKPKGKGKGRGKGKGKGKGKAKNETSMW